VTSQVRSATCVTPTFWWPDDFDVEQYRLYAQATGVGDVLGGFGEWGDAHTTLARTQRVREQGVAFETRWDSPDAFVYACAERWPQVAAVLNGGAATLALAAGARWYWWELRIAAERPSRVSSEPSVTHDEDQLRHAAEAGDSEAQFHLGMRLREQGGNAEPAFEARPGNRVACACGRTGPLARADAKGQIQTFDLTEHQIG
jgi:hypothetical protein